MRAVQEGTPADGALKTCPMCAEDIPAGADACEYCGASFEVTRTGYCPGCHGVGAVTAEGACSQCGAEAIDVRVESRHVEATPTAAPLPAVQAAAAPPPPPPPPAQPAQPVQAAAPPPPPPPAAPQGFAPVPVPMPVVQPQAPAYPPPPPPPPQPYPQPYQQPYPQQPYPMPTAGQATWTYQSGMGGLSVVPPEARGWNWGAFFLTWIWGIGNNTWMALLMFIPYVNFVMPFVLGAKGSEWAWRNKHWQSVEQFKSTQRTWAIIGAVVFAILVVLGVIAAVIDAANTANTTAGMTI